ncbi:hypothetical protein D3C78_1736860 [compost metagenome]
MHPHRLVLLITEDKTALGVGDFFTADGGEGDLRMRTTGIQVADDAIGDLCPGEEVPTVEGEIDGNAQQANANQRKKQA